MVKIHILTLFPEMFKGFLSESIPFIAQEKGQLSVNLVDIRDFSEDKHRKVDDYPYGGGAGLVMKPEPLASAIDSVSQTSDISLPVIYFTPQGRLLSQKTVREYLHSPEIVIVCGHYKEIDQRIREKYITDEISIGDYVLSGGELPAMVFTDAIARLLENVISDPESALTDSHENGLLGYPCYTRPYDFRGMKVPDVLVSGHHKEIDKWLKQKAIELTQKVRPEFLVSVSTEYNLSQKKTNVYLGLVHYPVYNKAGETITSGITNLDLHDISRSAMTYDIQRFFIIHPNDRQKEIFEHILAFWKTDIAAIYNQHRVDALSVIGFSKSINDTINFIKNQENNEPIIVTTTARHLDNQVSFEKIKKMIEIAERPILLLFGTGNGLHDDTHKQADFVLNSIKQKANYNHLSVRSAVAIVLDRLFSEE